MLHPSTKKLIDRLVEMTALGKVDWKNGEDDIVVYAAEGYSVSLEVEPNEMVITASDGRELERATEAELAEATDADGTSYTARVAEMTREAVRKAKGVDTAITSLLAGIDLDGDGIPDIPAEPEMETTIEAESVSELEDSGDESAPVSMEEVEAIEAEGSEANETVEAAAIVEPEVEDEGEATSVQSMTDETEETAIETAEEQVEEAAILTTGLAHTAEDNMTEAVARLADEVNGRDESPKDFEPEMVTEIEAEAVETAETVEAHDEASEETPFVEVTETAEEADTPEVEAVEEVETAAVEDISSVADHSSTSDESETETSNHTGSVLVGLGAASAGLAATVLNSGDKAEDVTQEDVIEEDGALVAGEPEADLPDVDLAEAPEVDPVEVEEPVAEFASANVETFVESTEEAAASATGAVSAEVSETVEAVQDTVVPFETPSFAPESAAVPEAVSETVAPLTEQAEALAETVEAPTEAIESGISLSGINAGFGLGTLTGSTDEASVVSDLTPAQATDSEAVVEQIVIDATDDVLLSDATEAIANEAQVETDLPEISDLQAGETSMDDTTPDAVAETEEEADEVSMTPKTRFNPWT